MITPRIRLALASGALFALAACGQLSANGNFAGGVDLWDAGEAGAGGVGGSHGGTGGSTGGTGGGTGASYDGLPCEVAQVFATHCGACHGSASGTPPALTSRADLLAAAPSGATWLAESLARMKSTTSPMPPSSSNNAVSAAEVAAVEAWLNQGAPASTCGTTFDAGTVTPPPPSDAGLNVYADLPCDVAQTLASKCSSCHGPTGTTPPKLVTRTDLLAVSSLGGMQADRCVTRMQSTTSPMPPAYLNTPATAAEIGSLQAWIAGGNQPGTCNQAIDAGTPGPLPTTCASGSYWTRGNNGDDNMRPGEPCRACHQTRKPSRMYAYMGTVYPGLHEKGNCNAMPPAGVTVEILNSSGQIVTTITPFSPSGNFFANRYGTAVPYTARVRVNGVLKSEMKGLQTNGDCNVCHTEQGTQGAPGRIVY